MNRNDVSSQEARLKELNKKIEKVNSALGEVSEGYTLFKVSSNYNFFRVGDDHDYSLPTLQTSEEINVDKRKALQYPISAYKGDNKENFTCKEFICDEKRVEELKNDSKTGFAKIPKNRALFFARNYIKPSTTDDFPFKEHFKKLFGNDFWNIKIGSKGKEFFGKSEDGKKFRPLACCFQILASQTYGKLSSHDLFAKSDRNHWQFDGKYKEKDYDANLVSNDWWPTVDILLSTRCSGEVLVLTGSSVDQSDGREYEDNYCTIERPSLISNQAVTSIIEVNIKYPELPSRIIIPNNENSREKNINMFGDSVNQILKYILADEKNIIVIDFGTSDYHGNDGTYKNLGEASGKGTVFLDVGKFLPLTKCLDKCDDREKFNAAVGAALIDYFYKAKDYASILKASELMKRYTKEIKELLDGSQIKREEANESGDRLSTSSGSDDGDKKIINQKLNVPKNIKTSGTELNDILDITSTYIEIREGLLKDINPDIGHEIAKRLLLKEQETKLANQGKCDIDVADLVKLASYKLSNNAFKSFAKIMFVGNDDKKEGGILKELEFDSNTKEKIRKAAKENKRKYNYSNWSDDLNDKVKNIKKKYEGILKEIETDFKSKRKVIQEEKRKAPGQEKEKYSKYKHHY